MGTLAAGIKEIFATAKTTGSNVMLCGNDGTPDGHMTMSNLASVLGGQIIVLSDNEDLDNIILDNMGQRTYRVGRNCQNKPIQDHDGYMTVYKWSNEKYATQMFYDPNNDTIYIRSNRNVSTVSFEPWSEFLPNVPHFYKDYNNLSALASALGVQIESFSGNSHYGYTFPTSDGFAIKLAINANSFVLFCLGNSGKFYYKYIWQGIDDVNWQLINVVQQ